MCYVLRNFAPLNCVRKTFVMEHDFLNIIEQYEANPYFRIFLVFAAVVLICGFYIGILHFISCWLPNLARFIKRIKK